MDEFADDVGHVVGMKMVISKIGFFRESFSKQTSRKFKQLHRYSKKSHAFVLEIYL
jgi:hypothetical protein